MLAWAASRAQSIRSFQGAVTNATTCNAGGFVGSVSDSPVILRCCVPRATVAANTSGQSDSYAGGFVASLDGGYVMDCYAIADVNADGSYVGGFAGFVDGLITNAYCVGSVTSSGSYHGAFAGGSGNSGTITKSYYDNSKAGLGAVNNAGYTGVTGRSSGQMYHAANFAFDFDDVWKIDEGNSTPYLRTFLVQVPEPELTGFQRFLVKYGLDVNTDPLYVTNGIPLIARYVYGIEPLNAQTDVNGHPLIDFKMNVNGKPVFELAPQKNPDEYGLTASRSSSSPRRRTRTSTALCSPFWPHRPSPRGSPSTSTRSTPPRTSASPTSARRLRPACSSGGAWSSRGSRRSGESAASPR